MTHATPAQNSDRRIVTVVFFMRCMICSPSELLVLLTIRTGADSVNRSHRQLRAR